MRYAPRLRKRAVVLLLAAAILFAQPIVTAFHTPVVHASNPTDSSSYFINSPRYVHTANGSDLGAQLIAYNATTKVEFYVDGNKNVSVVGIDYGVSSPGYHEWRFAGPLTAGQHIITGRVMTDGNWSSVSGSALVYALDPPSASYIFPKIQNNTFRLGDNPVRVQVDDTFNQFKNMEFSLYNYTAATNTFGTLVGTFVVNRSQCNLQGAGIFVLCDLKAGNNWENLNDGKYAVKLATSTQLGVGIHTTMSQYWSPPFIIDTTNPELKSFVLENSQAGVVDRAMDVAAGATDATSLEGVGFYLTHSRDDGICMGDRNKLTEVHSGTANLDGMYRAHFDTSSLAEGDYCVTAMARDNAMNSSEPQHLKITIRHVMHPTVTIDSDVTGRTVTGTISAAAAVFRVVIDGTLRNDAAVHISSQIGTAYKWSFVLPADIVAERDHTIEMIATIDGVDSDAARMTTTLMGTSKASGDLGGGSVRTIDPLLSQLKDKLNQPFPVPASFDAVSPQLLTPALQSQPDTAVLGSQIIKDPSTDLTTKMGAVVPTENGWKFFGLLWYWWALLAILAAIGMVWLTAKRHRVNITV